MNASSPLRHFRREFVVSVVLVLFAGCSLQNLDGLGPGKSGEGSSGDGGSSGSSGNGGSVAGGSWSGGGGSGATSGSSSVQGTAGTVAGSGNAAGGGNAAGAGNAAVAGNAAGGVGSTAGTANGGGGTKDSVCPAFMGTGGALLTPPSNDFEADTSGWATTALNAGAISIGQGDGNACSESSYLMCHGTGRTAAWDGPSIDLHRLMVPGGTYNVSVAARFAPATAPSTPQALRLVCGKECATTGVASSYPRLQEQLTDYKWVRLSGQVTASLAGCATIKRLMCYVETDSANASMSLHLDDFRLYDVTPQGAGGAAGAPSSTAGAPSSEAGAAGSAGRANVAQAGTAGI